MSDEKRGVKRKRQGKQVNKENSSAKEASLAGKLHHSIQVLTRAAKKARTFEVQKLTRKVKDDKVKPGTDAADLAAVKEQLQEVLVALKQLDIETLATNALHTKLAKDRNLASLPEVSEILSKSRYENADPTSATGKAQNKVLASKVFVEATNEVLASLRSRAGLKPATKSGKQETPIPKLDKGKQKAVQTSIPPTAQAAMDKLSKAKVKKASTSSTSDSTSDSSDSDGEEQESDDEDGTVSHISAEDADLLEGNEFHGFDQDDTDKEGNLSDASASSFPVSKPIKQKSKAAKKREAVAPAPTTSAFLPSLAGGYTLGDSDGSVYDYSDEEGGKAKPERKNRRGQRARQAIWEKKYGKNAKHVKQRQEREAETEENRRKARAEKEIEALKKSGRYVYGADANLASVESGKEARTWGQKGPISEASAAVADKPKKENVPHPSWEAKKRAKEAQASIAAAPVASKKIRFD